MSDLHIATENVLIDERVRGFPPGNPPLPLDTIGKQGWKPYDGRMALPLISLDRQAFSGNVELMMAYVKSLGAEIAPHAKTPMSTALSEALLAAGAWGTTVADIRQAAVLLKAGQRRLILANEIGGAAAARRLAALLGHYPDAELHIFVDSAALVEALRSAWQERADLPPLGLLVEFGAGRAGARNVAAAEAILEAILAVETPTFRLTGIAAYEGAAATADAEETMRRIDALMAVTSDFLPKLRASIGDERPLLVTAGGSVFFDLVIARLSAAVAADPACRLVLRSGAIFFHDHGIYDRALGALDERGGFSSDGTTAQARNLFRPALRLWAEVLSRPEPDLAICGLGMRDASFDQGFPVPLSVYRGGQANPAALAAEVTKLNDQHAFVKVDPESSLAVGDVIEFGISHPCTCLDRYRVIFGTDGAGTIRHAFPTFFG